MQDERKYAVKQRRTADLGYHSSAALLRPKMITANKGGGQVLSSLALKGMEIRFWLEMCYSNLCNTK